MSASNDNTSSVTLNGEPFLAKTIINPSLIAETANIIGTTYKGPAFVPQKLVSFANNDFKNTVSNIFGTREENRYQTLTDGFESKINSQAFKAADLWFLNGGTQCSLTRVLGIGTGTLNSNKGTYNDSGFIVSQLEYAGPNYFSYNADTISSTTYNADGDYNASLNFVIRKFKNYRSFGSESSPAQIDFRRNYLESLGITDTEQKFITDTIVTPKGVLLTLNDTNDRDGNDSNIKNELSTKTVDNNSLDFIGKAIKKLTTGDESNDRLYLNGFKGFNNIKSNIIEITDDNTSFTRNLIDYNGEKTKNYFYEKLYDKGHCYYTSYNKPLSLTGTKLSDDDNDDLIVLSSKTPSDGSIDYNDFNDKFQTAKTPWITSQPLNRLDLDDNRKDIHEENCVIDLFRFHSLDDGDVGNRFRIKIQPVVCGNAELGTYSQFDIHIFEYKSKNNSFIPLGSYKTLTLDPDDDNYIGRIFGTQHEYLDIETGKIVVEGFYRSVNDYLRVEIHEDVENKKIETNAMPSGFRAYPHVEFKKDAFDHYKNIDSIGIDNNNFSILNNVKMMPVEYTSNYFLSNTNDDILGLNYWGVLFNKTGIKIFPGGVGQLFKKRTNDTIFKFKNYTFQKDISDTNSFSPHYFYTKYFQSNLSSNDNNVWKQDDTFLNSYFNIERVIYPVDSNDDIVWEMSMYKRSGKQYSEMYELPTDYRDVYRYVNVDELLSPNNANHKTNSQYLSFDLFTYGGFDGVNIFDNNKRFLDNKAIITELSSTENGPTYFSYKKAIDIATDYSNCDGDILLIPGIRENKIVNQVIDICEESKRFIYLSDVLGKMSTGKMQVAKKNILGYDAIDHEENDIIFGDDILKNDNSTENLYNQSINKDYYLLRNEVVSEPDQDQIYNTHAAYKREIEENFNLITSQNVLRNSRYYLPLYNEVINDSERFVLDPAIYVLCQFGQTLNLVDKIDDINIVPNFSVDENIISPELIDAISLNDSNENFNKNLRSVLESGINCIGNITPDDVNSRSIKLLSANTTYENRESLFRQISNVRIINTIKKTLMINLFTSNKYVFGGVLFNQNSSINSIYEKAKFQIEDVLRVFKDNGVISDFMVNIPDVNDDRTMLDMQKYILRGYIYIQFNSDNSDSLVQLSLTDLLSELSLLTNGLQNFIIPVQ